jgi:hypothetical protein
VPVLGGGGNTPLLLRRTFHSGVVRSILNLVCRGKMLLIKCKMYYSGDGLGGHNTPVDRAPVIISPTASYDTQPFVIQNLHSSRVS